MSAYFTRLAIRTNIQAPGALYTQGQMTHADSQSDFRALESHTEINAPVEAFSVAQRVSNSVQQSMQPIQKQQQQARNTAPTHASVNTSAERLTTQRNTSLTDSEWQPQQQMPQQIEHEYYAAEDSVTNENSALDRPEKTPVVENTRITQTGISQVDAYEPLSAFQNIHSHTHTDSREHTENILNIVQTKTQSGADISRAHPRPTTSQHAVNVAAKEAYSESPLAPPGTDEKRIVQYSVVDTANNAASLNKTPAATQSNKAKQLSMHATEAGHEPGASGISVKIGAVSVEIHQPLPKSALAPAPRKIATRPTASSGRGSTVRLSRYYLRGI